MKLDNSKKVMMTELSTCGRNLYCLGLPPITCKERSIAINWCLMASSIIWFKNKRRQALRLTQSYTTSQGGTPASAAILTPVHTSSPVRQSQRHKAGGGTRRIKSMQFDGILKYPFLGRYI